MANAAISAIRCTTLAHRVGLVRSRMLTQPRLIESSAVPGKQRPRLGGRKTKA